MLYYSKDDASKFQFLLSQRKSQNGDNTAPARELAALKEMVNYCIVPGCRRYRLLKHFGEKMDDPKQVCDSSCDYCVDPIRVQRAIEAASAVNDFTFHSRQPQLRARNPVDDDDDDDDSVLQDLDAAWNVDGLNIKGRGSALINDDEFSADDMSTKKPIANFVKASSILSKYEAIECKSAGFVNFKEKKGSESKTDDRIRIPKHLIPLKKSDPPAQFNKNCPVVQEKRSADYAAEAVRLRDELAKAKVEREARQLQTMNRSRDRPPPPPPPSLSFTAKRKR